MDEHEGCKRDESDAYKQGFDDAVNIVFNKISEFDEIALFSQHVMLDKLKIHIKKEIKQMKKDL